MFKDRPSTCMPCVLILTFIYFSCVGQGRLLRLVSGAQTDSSSHFAAYHLERGKVGRVRIDVNIYFLGS